MSTVIGLITAFSYFFVCTHIVLFVLFSLLLILSVYFAQMSNHWILCYLSFPYNFLFSFPIMFNRNKTTKHVHSLHCVNNGISQVIDSLLTDCCTFFRWWVILYIFFNDFPVKFLNYNSLDLAGSRFVKLHSIKAKLLYIVHVQTIMKRKAEIIDDYDKIYFVL